MSHKKNDTIKLSTTQSMAFISNADKIYQDFIAHPKDRKWEVLDINSNSTNLDDLDKEWQQFQEHVAAERIVIKECRRGFSLSGNEITVPHQFKANDPQTHFTYVEDFFKNMSGLIVTSNRLLAIKEEALNKNVSAPKQDAHVMRFIRIA